MTSFFIVASTTWFRYSGLCCLRSKRYLLSRIFILGEFNCNSGGTVITSVGTPTRTRYNKYTFKYIIFRKILFIYVLFGNILKKWQKGSLTLTFPKKNQRVYTFRCYQIELFCLSHKIVPKVLWGIWQIHLDNSLQFNLLIEAFIDTRFICVLYLFQLHS